MSRKGTYYIELMGFTPERYLELVAQEMDDKRIYENILQVSRTAFVSWKKRHGLTGTFSPSKSRYYHKRGQCVIEDQGFTVEDYHKLRAKGITNTHIHEEILHVSLATWLRWKRKHKLVGDSNPKPRMEDAKRVTISNEMREKGLPVAAICRVLKIKDEHSYYSWRSNMRKKGYELI